MFKEKINNLPSILFYSQPCEMTIVTIYGHRTCTINLFINIYYPENLFFSLNKL